MRFFMCQIKRNRTNPKHINKSIGFYTLFCMRHFSQTISFQRDVQSMLVSCLHSFVIGFRVFRVVFCLVFITILMNSYTKMESKSIPKSSKGPNLAPLGLSWRHLGTPFGLLGTTLGPLGPPFVMPWPLLEQFLVTWESQDPFQDVFFINFHQI